MCVVFCVVIIDVVVEFLLVVGVDSDIVIVWVVDLLLWLNIFEILWLLLLIIFLGGE